METRRKRIYEQIDESIIRFPIVWKLNKIPHCSFFFSKRLIMGMKSDYRIRLVSNSRHIEWPRGQTTSRAFPIVNGGRCQSDRSR